MKRLSLCIAGAAIGLAAGLALAVAIRTTDHQQKQPATTYSATYYITAVEP